MLTLFMPISSIIADSANHFEVLLSMEDGTATIGEEQIRATLSGQGLAAGISDWNGRLSFTDDFAGITIPQPIVPVVSLVELEDSLTLSVVPPSAITPTDTAPSFSIPLPNVPTVSISTPVESVSVGEVHNTTIISTLYASRYQYDPALMDLSGDTFKLQRQYSYTGEAAEVDSGLLTSQTLPFPEFDAINEVEVGE